MEHMMFLHSVGVSVFIGIDMKVSGKTVESWMDGRTNSRPIQIVVGFLIPVCRVFVL